MNDGMKCDNLLQAVIIAVQILSNQELFPKTPASIWAARRSDFGERDLYEGQMAEGEVLAANTLGGPDRSIRAGRRAAGP